MVLDIVFPVLIWLIAAVLITVELSATALEVLY